MSKLPSCGHRFCNQCQNQSTEQWLERQRQKPLPVHYYMVTFTLPYELRGLARYLYRGVLSNRNLVDSGRSADLKTI